MTEYPTSLPQAMAGEVQQAPSAQSQGVGAASTQVHRAEVPRKGKLLGTVAFLGLGEQEYIKEITDPEMSSYQTCGRLVLATSGGYLSIGTKAAGTPVNAKFGASASCRQSAHNRPMRSCNMA